MPSTCHTADRQGWPLPPTHAEIALKIAAYGQHVIGVLADDEDDPSFAYTIGRTDRGQPELLIFTKNNASLTRAGNILNFLGPREVKDGHVIGLEGEAETYLAADLNNFPELHAQAHEDFVVQADHYYGRPVDLLILCPMGVDGEEEEDAADPPPETL